MKKSGTIIRMKSVSDSGIVAKGKEYNLASVKTAARHIVWGWGSIVKADKEMEKLVIAAKKNVKALKEVKS